MSEVVLPISTSGAEEVRDQLERMLELTRAAALPPEICRRAIFSPALYAACHRYVAGDDPQVVFAAAHADLATWCRELAERAAAYGCPVDVPPIPPWPAEAATGALLTGDQVRALLVAHAHSADLRAYAIRAAELWSPAVLRLDEATSGSRTTAEVHALVAFGRRR